MNEERLSIGTRIRVWFNCKEKYFEGAISGETELEDQYTITWDDKRAKREEPVVLMKCNCHDDITDTERWNLL